MTYFTLFSLIIIAFAAVVILLRLGQLEDRIALVERDHHALARKGDRVRPTLWHNVVSGEDADYD